MEAFLTVVVAAFVAQLAVLPGEKVQLIIAGLSTRFHPAIVVGAAGLAFGGWTAAEILLGRALKNALPPAYLAALSGALFFLFGVLLLWQMPDRPGERTDGGLNSSEEVDLPFDGLAGSGRIGTFVSIFILMATGEFGDKTQLVTINLAVTYGAHPGIWVGEMLAIIPVSIVNAYFFHRFARRVDMRVAHIASAALFFFFGADTFLGLATGFSIWETVTDALAGMLSSVFLLTLL